MKPKTEEPVSTALVTIDQLESDVKLQQIIVVEHFFRKKGVEQLSKKLGISPLDLRFFINSIEAYNLYRELKSTFEERPTVDSIEELSEFIIDKTKEYLEHINPIDAGELIEKIIPQIINLQNSIKGSSNRSFIEIEEAQFTEISKQNTSNEFYSPLQLISEKPRLFTEAELKEINPITEDGDAETSS